MVAPVENLTRLSGTVRSRQPHPRLSGWDAVSLDVDTAQAVPGRADLLSGRPDVEFAVRQDLLGAAAAGSRLSCRVKLTPKGAMCEPHPAPGDFTVSPGES